MSMVSIMVYALISSLIVSSLSLSIFRIISRRKQQTVDRADTQIVRLVAQSLAFNGARNLTISRKVENLLASPPDGELQPHQEEVLRWLHDLVKCPELDAAPEPVENEDDNRVGASDTVDQFVEYLSIASRRNSETSDELDSFLSQYGRDGAEEQVAQIRELATELKSDVDPDRRANAAIKLGQIGDASGVPHLVRALRNDGAGQVRTFSAVALGMIGSNEAVSPLIDVIKTQITERIDIPHNISYGGFQLIRTLQREIDPEPTEWLGQDPIAAQIWALGRIGSAQACDALVERLSDRDPGIRWFAAWALGKIGSQRIVPALVALFDDPVDDVRWIAIWALGRMNSTRAVERLIACTADANPSIRRIAIWALGRGGHHRSRAIVEDALTDSERGVRQVASWALSRIEPEMARSA